MRAHTALQDIAGNSSHFAETRFANRNDQETGNNL